jgi:ATP-dependent Lon protease
VILPERCRKDLVDVPEQAKKELEFIFVTQMDDVLKAALETAPFKDAPVPVAEPAAPEVRA